MSNQENPNKVQDIHEYLAAFDDIPGTRVFIAKRARQGYHMNQFAMSLMNDENRQRFKADERAYLDEWPMTEEQKQALLDRDYNRALDLGGNVYFLAKLFSTDGFSFAEAVSTMTDMTFPEYTQMMINGGRPPEGNRSIKENEAKAAIAKVAMADQKFAGENHDANENKEGR